MKKIFCVIALFLPVFVQAQECTNVKKLKVGYELDINGDTHTAVPKKTFALMRDQILAANKLTDKVTALEAELEKSKANAAKYQQHVTELKNLNQKYQTLNDDYSSLNDKYKTTANKLVDLNKDYKGALTEFDDLVEKYRKIAVRTNPRSTWDFGVGMLNPTDDNLDPHYFAAVGAGAKLLNTEFRGWLLAGDDSYGIMAGLSF